MPRVVVIGGGVAGMALAWELLERSARSTDRVEVTCHEAGHFPGGAVQTERTAGFLLESGPIGLRESGAHVRSMIRRLGLEPRRVVATAASSAHHVFRAGRLQPLPHSVRALLLGNVLPPAARFRVLAEPLIRAKHVPPDESVEAFAVRRLGRRAGTLLADALATAMAAGDSRRLSMRSVFPRLRSMEADHGSLFRALRSRPPGHAPTDRALVSFIDGLAELPRALAERLGERLVTGGRVSAVSGMGGRGVRVMPDSGPPLDVDAAVLACPAAEAAALVRGSDAELARELSGIPAPRVARVHLGYPEAASSRWPAGAGFVVPRGQGLRMLGTEWVSNIFPGRAPAGSHLLTVSFGGARDPGALDLHDQALIDHARADLRLAIGLVADPCLARVVRDVAGFPQHDVGHTERLVRIARRLARQPGLHLGGCSYGVPELGACLDEAPRVADTILESLAARALAAG